MLLRLITIIAATLSLAAFSFAGDPFGQSIRLLNGYTGATDTVTSAYEVGSALLVCGDVTSTGYDSSFSLTLTIQGSNDLTNWFTLQAWSAISSSTVTAQCVKNAYTSSGNAADAKYVRGSFDFTAGTGVTQTTTANLFIKTYKRATVH